MNNELEAIASRLLSILQDLQQQAQQTDQALENIFGLEENTLAAQVQQISDALLTYQRVLSRFASANRRSGFEYLQRGIENLNATLDKLNVERLEGIQKGITQVRDLLEQLTALQDRQLRMVLQVAESVLDVTTSLTNLSDAFRSLHTVVQEVEPRLITMFKRISENSDLEEIADGLQKIENLLRRVENNPPQVHVDVFINRIRSVIEVLDVLRGRLLSVFRSHHKLKVAVDYRGLQRDIVKAVTSALREAQKGQSIRLVVAEPTERTAGRKRPKPKLRSYNVEESPPDAPVPEGRRILPKPKTPPLSPEERQRRLEQQKTKPYVDQTIINPAYTQEAEDIQQKRVRRIRDRQALQQKYRILSEEMLPDLIAQVLSEEGLQEYIGKIKTRAELLQLLVDKQKERLENKAQQEQTKAKRRRRTNAARETWILTTATQEQENRDPSRKALEQMQEAIVEEAVSMAKLEDQAKRRVRKKKTQEIQPDVQQAVQQAVQQQIEQAAEQAASQLADQIAQQQDVQQEAKPEKPTRKRTRKKQPAAPLTEEVSAVQAVTEETKTVVEQATEQVVESTEQAVRQGLQEGLQQAPDVDTQKIDQVVQQSVQEEVQQAVEQAIEQVVESVEQAVQQVVEQPKKRRASRKTKKQQIPEQAAEQPPSEQNVPAQTAPEPAVAARKTVKPSVQEQTPRQTKKAKGDVSAVAVEAQQLSPLEEAERKVLASFYRTSKSGKMQFFSKKVPSLEQQWSDIFVDSYKNLFGRFAVLLLEQFLKDKERITAELKEQDVAAFEEAYRKAVEAVTSFQQPTQELLQDPLFKKAYDDLRSRLLLTIDDIYMRGDIEQDIEQQFLQDESWKAKLKQMTQRRKPTTEGDVSFLQLTSEEAEPFVRGKVRESRGLLERLLSGLASFAGGALEWLNRLLSKTRDKLSSVELKIDTSALSSLVQELKKHLDTALSGIAVAFQSTASFAQSASASFAEGLQDVLRLLREAAVGLADIRRDIAASLRDVFSSEIARLDFADVSTPARLMRVSMAFADAAHENESWYRRFKSIPEVAAWMARVSQGELGSFEELREAIKANEKQLAPQTITEMLMFVDKLQQSLANSTWYAPSAPSQFVTSKQDVVTSAALRSYGYKPLVQTLSSLFNASLEELEAQRNYVKDIFEQQTLDLLIAAKRRQEPVSLPLQQDLLLLAQAQLRYYAGLHSLSANPVNAAFGTFSSAFSHVQQQLEELVNAIDISHIKDGFIYAKQRFEQLVDVLTSSLTQVEQLRSLPQLTKQFVSAFVSAVHAAYEALSELLNFSFDRFDSLKPFVDKLQTTFRDVTDSVARLMRMLQEQFDRFSRLLDVSADLAKEFSKYASYTEGGTFSTLEHLSTLVPFLTKKSRPLPKRGSQEQAVVLEEKIQRDLMYGIYRAVADDAPFEEDRVATYLETVRRALQESKSGIAVVHGTKVAFEGENESVGHTMLAYPDPSQQGGIRFVHLYPQKNLFDLVPKEELDEQAQATLREGFAVQAIPVQFLTPEQAQEWIRAVEQIVSDPQTRYGAVQRDTPEKFQFETCASVVVRAANNLDIIPEDVLAAKIANINVPTPTSLIYTIAKLNRGLLDDAVSLHDIKRTRVFTSGTEEITRQRAAQNVQSFLDTLKALSRGTALETLYTHPLVKEWRQKIEEERDVPLLNTAELAQWLDTNLSLSEEDRNLFVRHIQALEQMAKTKVPDTTALFTVAPSFTPTRRDVFGLHAFLERLYEQAGEDVTDFSSLYDYFKTRGEDLDILSRYTLVELRQAAKAANYEEQQTHLLRALALSTARLHDSVVFTEQDDAPVNTDALRKVASVLLQQRTNQVLFLRTGSGEEEEVSFAQEDKKPQVKRRKLNLFKLMFDDPDRFWKGLVGYARAFDAFWLIFRRFFQFNLTGLIKAINTFENAKATMRKYWEEEIVPETPVEPRFKSRREAAEFAVKLFARPFVGLPRSPQRDIIFQRILPEMLERGEDIRPDANYFRDIYTVLTPERRKRLPIQALDLQYTYLKLLEESGLELTPEERKKLDYLEKMKQKRAESYAEERRPPDDDYGSSTPPPKSPPPSSPPPSRPDQPPPSQPPPLQPSSGPSSSAQTRPSDYETSRALVPAEQRQYKAREEKEDDVELVDSSEVSADIKRAMSVPKFDRAPFTGRNEWKDNPPYTRQNQRLVYRSDFLKDLQSEQYWRYYAGLPSTRKQEPKWPVLSADLAGVLAALEKQDEVVANIISSFEKTITVLSDEEALTMPVIRDSLASIVAFRRVKPSIQLPSGIASLYAKYADLLEEEIRLAMSYIVSVVDKNNLETSIDVAKADDVLHSGEQLTREHQLQSLHLPSFDPNAFNDEIERRIRILKNPYYIDRVTGRARSLVMLPQEARYRLSASDLALLLDEANERSQEAFAAVMRILSSVSADQIAMNEELLYLFAAAERYRLQRDIPWSKRFKSIYENLRDLVDPLVSTLKPSVNPALYSPNYAFDTAREAFTRVRRKAVTPQDEQNNREKQFLALQSLFAMSGVYIPPDLDEETLISLTKLADAVEYYAEMGMDLSDFIRKDIQDVLEQARQGSKTIRADEPEIEDSVDDDDEPLFLRIPEPAQQTRLVRDAIIENKVAVDASTIHLIADYTEHLRDRFLLELDALLRKRALADFTDESSAFTSYLGKHARLAVIPTSATDKRFSEKVAHELVHAIVHPSTVPNQPLPIDVSSALEALQSIPTALSERMRKLLQTDKGVQYFADMNEALAFHGQAVMTKDEELMRILQAIYTKKLSTKVVTIVKDILRGLADPAEFAALSSGLRSLIPPPLSEFDVKQQSDERLSARLQKQLRAYGVKQPDRELYLVYDELARLRARLKKEMRPVDYVSFIEDNPIFESLFLGKAAAFVHPSPSYSIIFIPTDLPASGFSERSVFTHELAHALDPESLWLTDNSSVFPRNRVSDPKFVSSVLQRLQKQKSAFALSIKGQIRSDPAKALMRYGSPAEAFAYTAQAHVEPDAEDALNTLRLLYEGTGVFETSLAKVSSIFGDLLSNVEKYDAFLRDVFGEGFAPLSTTTASRTEVAKQNIAAHKSLARLYQRLALMPDTAQFIDESLKERLHQYADSSVSFLQTGEEKKLSRSFSRMQSAFVSFLLNYPVQFILDHASDIYKRVLALDIGSESFDVEEIARNASKAAKKNVPFFARTPSGFLSAVPVSPITSQRDSVWNQLINIGLALGASQFEELMTSNPANPEVAAAVDVLRKAFVFDDRQQEAMSLIQRRFNLSSLDIDASVLPHWMFALAQDVFLDNDYAERVRAFVGDEAFQAARSLRHKTRHDDIESVIEHVFPLVPLAEKHYAEVPEWILEQHEHVQEFLQAIGRQSSDTPLRIASGHIRYFRSFLEQTVDPETLEEFATTYPLFDYDLAKHKSHLGRAFLGEGLRAAFVPYLRNRESKYLSESFLHELAHLLDPQQETFPLYQDRIENIEALSSSAYAHVSEAPSTFAQVAKVGISSNERIILDYLTNQLEMFANVAGSFAFTKEDFTKAFEAVKSFYGHVSDFDAILSSVHRAFGGILQDTNYVQSFLDRVVYQASAAARLSSLRGSKQYSVQAVKLSSGTEEFTEENEVFLSLLRRAMLGKLHAFDEYDILSELILYRDPVFASVYRNPAAKKALYGDTETSVSFLHAAPSFSDPLQDVIAAYTKQMVDVITTHVEKNYGSVQMLGDVEQFMQLLLPIITTQSQNAASMIAQALQITEDQDVQRIAERLTLSVQQALVDAFMEAGKATVQTSEQAVSTAGKEEHATVSQDTAHAQQPASTVSAADVATQARTLYQHVRTVVDTVLGTDAFTSFVDQAQHQFFASAKDILGKLDQARRDALDVVQKQVERVLTPEAKQMTEEVVRTLRDVFKDTEIDILLEDMMFVVGDTRSLIEASKIVLGEADNAFKKIVQNVVQGSATGFQTETDIARSLIGIAIDKQNRIPLVETLMHEITHAVVKGMDKRLREQGQAPRFATDYLKKLMEDIAKERAPGRKELAERIRAEAPAASYIADLVESDFDYLSSPDELFAFVGQAIFAQNQELERALRMVYGNRAFDLIATTLRSTMPEVAERVEQLYQRMTQVQSKYNQQGLGLFPDLEPLHPRRKATRTVLAALTDLVRDFGQKAAVTIDRAFLELTYELDNMSGLGQTLRAARDGLRFVFQDVVPKYSDLIGQNADQFMNDAKEFLEVVDEAFNKLGKVLLRSTGEFLKDEFIRSMNLPLLAKQITTTAEIVSRVTTKGIALVEAAANRVASSQAFTTLAQFVQKTPIGDIAQRIATELEMLQRVAEDIAMGGRFEFTRYVVSRFANKPDEQATRLAQSSFVQELTTQLLGASLRNVALSDEQKASFVFDTFKKQFERRYNTQLLETGFSVSPVFDLETGLVKLEASARTAAGAVVQLSGTIDQFGEIEVSFPSKIEQLRDRIKREFLQEGIEEIVEEILYGAIFFVFNTVEQVKNLQDEVQQLRNLFLVSDLKAGLSAYTEVNRMLQDTISIAAQTGQNFEDAIQGIISTFKMLAYVSDFSQRRDLALRLTSLQLGGQSVFGLSRQQGGELIPSLIAQLSDEIRLASPDSAPSQTVEDTAKALEHVYNLVLLAQRESGAAATDILQVFTGLLGTVSALSMTPEELVSLSSAAAVRLGKSPEETLNSMKFFLERLYSPESEEKLKRYGIYTKAIDESGQISYRSLSSIVKDIQAQIKEEPSFEKIIANILGARARASEVVAILRSFEDKERIQSTLLRSGTGLEFEQQFEFKQASWEGAVNSASANIGNFVQTVLFGTGIVDQLGKVLVGVTHPLSFISDVFVSLGDTLLVVNPFIREFVETLFFLFLNLGKTITNFIAHITNRIISPVALFSFQDVLPLASLPKKALHALEENFTQAQSAVSEGAVSLARALETLDTTLQTKITDIKQTIERLRLEAEKTSQPSFLLDPKVPASKEEENRAALLAQQAQLQAIQAQADAVTTAAQTAQAATVASAQADALEAKTSLQAAQADALETKASLQAAQADSMQTKATSHSTSRLQQLSSAVTQLETGVRNASSFLHSMAKGAMSNPYASQSVLWGMPNMHILRKGLTAASELAIPVAFDIIASLGDDVSFQESATKIGAGIAGGIAGALLSGGNPLGVLIGYQMAQAFAASFDLAALWSTTEREQMSVASQYIQFTPEQRAKLVDLYTSGRLEEIRSSLNEAVSANTASLSALFGVRELELLKTIIEKPEVNISDIGSVLSFLSAPEKTSYSYLRDRYETEKQYGIESTVSRAFALYEQLAAIDKELPALVASFNVSTFEELIPLIEGIATKSHPMQQRLDQARREIMRSQESNIYVSSVDDIIAQTERALEQVSSSTRKQTTHTPLSLGTGYLSPAHGYLMTSLLGALETTPEDQFDALFDAYQQAIRRQQTLAQEMPSLAKMEQVLGIDTIVEQFRLLGYEGQQAFLTVVEGVQEAIQYSEEYETLAKQIALLEQERMKYSPVTAPEEYEQLTQVIDKYQERLGSMQQLYDLYQAYLASLQREPSLLSKAFAVAKAYDKKARVVGGSPARFRMPSLFDVSEYSLEDIQAALRDARAKQTDIVQMFPQMAEEFAKEQFIFEAAGQYAPVTGISLEYVRDALQKRKKQTMVPDIIDLREYSADQVQKIIQDALLLQQKATELAPALAKEYQNEQLLLLQQNNDLLLQTGLSQEFLRYAIEQNTKSTEDNTSELRGHYNLPASYRPPTIWDYYASGGTSAGAVNYVPPPSAMQGTVPLDLARSIAQASLQATTSDVGAPDLSRLGSLIDPRARPLGYPEPGTPGKVIFPEMMDLPEGLQTNALYVNNVPLAEVLRDRTSLEKGKSDTTAYTLSDVLRERQESESAFSHRNGSGGSYTMFPATAMLMQANNARPSTSTGLSLPMQMALAPNSGFAASAFSSAANAIGDTFTKTASLGMTAFQQATQSFVRSIQALNLQQALQAAFMSGAISIVVQTNGMQQQVTKNASVSVTSGRGSPSLVASTGNASAPVGKTMVR